MSDIGFYLKVTNIGRLRWRSVVLDRSYLGTRDKRAVMKIENWPKYISGKWWRKIKVKRFIRLYVQKSASLCVFTLSLCGLCCPDKELYLRLLVFFFFFNCCCSTRLHVLTQDLRWCLCVAASCYISTVLCPPRPLSFRDTVIMSSGLRHIIGELRQAAARTAGGEWSCGWDRDIDTLPPPPPLRSVSRLHLADWPCLNSRVSSFLQDKEPRGIIPLENLSIREVEEPRKPVSDAPPLIWPPIGCLTATFRHLKKKIK